LLPARLEPDLTGPDLAGDVVIPAIEGEVNYPLKSHDGVALSTTF
jgi:hypothetical protein